MKIFRPWNEIESTLVFTSLSLLMSLSDLRLTSYPVKSTTLAEDRSRGIQDTTAVVVVMLWTCTGTEGSSSKDEVITQRKVNIVIRPIGVKFLPEIGWFVSVVYRNTVSNISEFTITSRTAQFLCIFRHCFCPNPVALDSLFHFFFTFLVIIWLPTVFNTKTVNMSNQITSY